MAINSKAKGDNFERKIANLLSDRFASFLKLKKAFIRNLGSGSRFGGKNARIASFVTEEAKQVGDIVVPKSFKFNIECKSYGNPPSFKSIIEQKVTQWDKWVEQAEADNKTSGKDYWVVIMKYNLVPPMCILPNSLLSEFDPIISYKDTFIITLNSFLNKPDEFYFKMKESSDE